MNLNVGDVCSIVSTVLSVCTFVGGAIGFLILKFNDFAHISADLKNSEKDFLEFKKDVSGKLNNLLEIHNENKQQLAVIEERCEIHHNSVSKRRKKV